MRRMGFEGGWGANVGLVKESMHGLLEILQAPDDDTVASFLGRLPMINDVGVVYLGALLRLDYDRRALMVTRDAGWGLVVIQGAWWLALKLDSAVYDLGFRDPRSRDPRVPRPVTHKTFTHALYAFDFSLHVIHRYPHSDAIGVTLQNYGGLDSK